MRRDGMRNNKKQQTCSPSKPNENKKKKKMKKSTTELWASTQYFVNYIRLFGCLFSVF